MDLDAAVIVEITESPILVHRWAMASGPVGYGGESYDPKVIQEVRPGGDGMRGPSGPTVISFHLPQEIDWRRDPGPLEALVRWVVKEPGTFEWTVVHAVRGRFSGLRRAPDGLFTVEVERLRGTLGDTVQTKWSNEDQEARYPGDRGLEYMTLLADEGITLAWPPEEGYGERIGPTPVVTPTVPDQLTSGDGQIEIFNGVTQVAVPGNITATLFDNDQPLSNIVWTWKRRDSASDTSLEDVYTQEGRERSAYATQAGDVGKQIQATVVYDDAKGTGMSIASVWVSVVAGGGGGNGGGSNGDGGNT